MRKQINGLSAIAQDKQAAAIFSGSYFVFLVKVGLNFPVGGADVFLDS